MAILGARVFVVILAAYTLAACAIGNTYDYRAAKPSLKASASRSISVGVLDRRPYVLSGNKPPSFVGLQRAGHSAIVTVNTLGRSLSGRMFIGAPRLVSESMILPTGRG